VWRCLPFARNTAVFLSVFKWEARKGWDVLLDAYLTEFTAGDPVELHIMTKPFGTQKDVRATTTAAALIPVCMELTPPAVDGDSVCLCLVAVS
jgi:hypothetical protein